MNRLERQSPDRPYMPMENNRQTLTKRLLLGLPEGTYILGNSILGNDVIFAAVVEGDREKIWRRIRAVSANGRLCTLCQYLASFERAKKEMLDTFHGPQWNN